MGEEDVIPLFDFFRWGWEVAAALSSVGEE
jgi:hypothetical protein